MRAGMALCFVFDPIDPVLLALVEIVVGQQAALRADIMVVVGIVLKPGLVKWLRGCVMGLLFGRNDDRNVLVVNLFGFLGVGITGVATGLSALFAQVFMGLLYLVGKLMDVGALADHIAMHDQPVFFIDHDLAVVPGMETLTTLDLDAVRVGGIETAVAPFLGFFVDGLYPGL